MSRDRTDSNFPFKKYEKAEVNDNQDFDSPLTSPLLTSTAIHGMQFNSLNTHFGNNNLQNILLQNLGP